MYDRKTSLEMAREIVSSGFMRPDKINLMFFTILSAGAVVVFAAGFLCGINIPR